MCCDINIKLFCILSFHQKRIGLRVSKLISIPRQNYHNSVQINTRYSGGPDLTRVVSIFFFRWKLSCSVWVGVIQSYCNYVLKGNIHKSLFHNSIKKMFIDQNSNTTDLSFIFGMLAVFLVLAASYSERNTSLVR